MKFKETETIELKRSTAELKEAIISVAAILNKHGNGELYFGIKDDGTVLGQQISAKTLREISQAILENIEPKIYPKIQSLKIQQKTCVKVSFEGKDAPYFAYGRAYMRTADESRQLSARELEHLIIKKNKDKLHWDTEICRQAKLSDISVEKLKIFLKAAGLRYDSIRNALGKLKLLSGGKLLNAAVILFAKQPQDFFPNAKLRCAVFGGTDTSYIVDRKEFEGDLFCLIEKAQEYILEKTNLGMKLEGLRRVDVPEIEKDAFREAIINAFCHRDYREYDSVNIAVFKDRLEIRNPGLLYGDLTIEKITSKMVSERRNELIAELFHRIHFIEKWGRGIRLILSKEPRTEFEEVGNHFIVRFERKPAAPEGGEKVGDRVGVKVGEKVTENQSKILNAIGQNAHINAKELSLLVGISTRKIEENIRKLKEKGLLKRTGPAKGGYWEIIHK